MTTSRGSKTFNQPTEDQKATFEAVMFDLGIPSDRLQGQINQINDQLYSQETADIADQLLVPAINDLQLRKEAINEVRSEMRQEAYEAWKLKQEKK